MRLKPSRIKAPSGSAFIEKAVDESSTAVSGMLVRTFRDFSGDNSRIAAQVRTITKATSKQVGRLKFIMYILGERTKGTVARAVETFGEIGSYVFEITSRSAPAPVKERVPADPLLPSGGEQPVGLSQYEPFANVFDMNTREFSGLFGSKHLAIQ
jgi:hypothetical protein